jgi:hypothetical protein
VVLGVRTAGYRLVRAGLWARRYPRGNAGGSSMVLQTGVEVRTIDARRKCVSYVHIAAIVHHSMWVVAPDRVVSWLCT